MLDVFEKILIVLLIVCIVFLFACYGIIFYKAATVTGDDKFFARKVYIVNQGSYKEDK